MLGPRPTIHSCEAGGPAFAVPGAGHRPRRKQGAGAQHRLDLPPDNSRGARRVARAAGAQMHSDDSVSASSSCPALCQASTETGKASAAARGWPGQARPSPAKPGQARPRRNWGGDFLLFGAARLFSDSSARKRNSGPQGSVGYLDPRFSRGDVYLSRGARGFDAAWWLIVMKDVSMRAEQDSETGETEAEDLFEMANLYPDTTGLPITVWVGPRGTARHDVRVKVNMTHGNQMNIANTAVVGVRPTPRVLARPAFAGRCAGGLPMGRRECGGAGRVLGGTDRHGGDDPCVETAVASTRRARCAPGSP